MRRLKKKAVSCGALVVALLIGLLVLSAQSARGVEARAQSPAVPWKERFDQEMRARAAKIVPRKIKTRGKLKVARWEDVDAQLASAVRILDAKTLLEDLVPFLQGGGKQPSIEQRSEIDQLLAGHKISYNALFLIEDERAHFPLTNNVLKLSGDEGLADLEIFEGTGFSLGNYAGKYIYEKTGGLAYGGGSYRLTYFQYRDNEGNLRPSGNTNLLDTYSIRWREVKDQAFLQLSADALFH
jgi:hypothetical protein